MKEIEYKNLRQEDLKAESCLFVFDNGYTTIVEIKSNKAKLKLNDELLDKPFSSKDINLLKDNFGEIENAVIENKWGDKKNPPFHHNELILETLNLNILYRLIRFIFEKIYKINE